MLMLFTTAVLAWFMGDRIGGLSRNPESTMPVK
jgi:hypothetical protein